VPKIRYCDLKFKPKALQTIKTANSIIEEYAAQGFNLTLRQLYYQFVARGFIANKLSEYKKLQDTISNARLAGLIDWLAIVDRTRFLRSLPHWQNPAHIVKSVSEQFRIDKWATQPYRLEVWIEKDALVGIIEGICDEFDVPYFSCRGYTSQSEMWSAAQRLKAYASKGQTPLIFHFGDHDPSGMDMTRDITDRLHMFMGGMEINRLALNMDQVEEYNPPPNPAKLTDTRAEAYIAEFGNSSWELDALDPATLAQLIRDEIATVMDQDAWDEAETIEKKGREELTEISDKYGMVVDYLNYR
jgi:hypothetical protein